MRSIIISILILLTVSFIGCRMESNSISYVEGTEKTIINVIELDTKCLDGYVVYIAGNAYGSSYFYKLVDGKQIKCIIFK